MKHNEFLTPCALGILLSVILSRWIVYWLGSLEDAFGRMALLID